MKLPRWRDSASLRPLVSASLRLRLARPQVGGQLISRAVRCQKRNSHFVYYRFYKSMLSIPKLLLESKRGLYASIVRFMTNLLPPVSGWLVPLGSFRGKHVFEGSIVLSNTMT